MPGTIGCMEHPAQEPRPSVTCPDCGLTSCHPEDVASRYCGSCRWWTSDPFLAPHNPSPPRPPV
jgi:hypothetical protein